MRSTEDEALSAIGERYELPPPLMSYRWRLELVTRWIADVNALLEPMRDRHAAFEALGGGREPISSDCFPLMSGMNAVFVVDSRYRARLRVLSGIVPEPDDVILCAMQIGTGGLLTAQEAVDALSALIQSWY